MLLSQFRIAFSGLEVQFLFDSAILKTIQTGNAFLLGGRSSDLFFCGFNLCLRRVVLSLSSEAYQEEKEESNQRFHVLRFIYIKRKDRCFSGVSFAEKPLFFGI